MNIVSFWTHDGVTHFHSDRRNNPDADITLKGLRTGEAVNVTYALGDSKDLVIEIRSTKIDFIFALCSEL